jgi:hypothetical protein
MKITIDLLFPCKFSWVTKIYDFNVQLAVYQLYSGRERVQNYIKWKLYRNEGRVESTGITTFDCCWKKYGELGRDEKCRLLQQLQHAYTLRNLQKRSLVCREHGTLQRRYHYGPRSGFPYYNLTTSQEVFRYPPSGDALGSSVGLSPGNISNTQSFHIHWVKVMVFNDISYENYIYSCEGNSNEYIEGLNVCTHHRWKT